MNSLAVILKRRHKFDLAEQSYLDSLATMKEALRMHPRNLDTRQSISQTTYNLGSLAMARQQPSKAQLYFEESLASVRTLISEFPSAPILQSQEIRTLTFLSLANKKLGDVAAAEQNLIAAHEAGLSINRQLRTPDLIHITSQALNNFGNLLMSQDQLDPAERYFFEAVELSMPLVEQGDTAHRGMLGAIAVLFHNLGGISQQQGDYDQMLERQSKSLAFHLRTVPKTLSTQVRIDC